MKDTEGRDKEEKHRYIFAPNPDFKEGRFNWITNNLLGDIRMFLDGIEYFRIQGKEKTAGKLPRGGGNLSAPILINTALEFVAELYAGKTNYMKFDTDITFKEDLENGVISEELKEEFTIRKFPLPETYAITKTDKGWEIKDAEAEKLYYIIDIKYAKGKEKELVFHFLDNVKYEAAENAKSFILRYFPEEYKIIPSLLWDGIRNGLVHTFSPKPFTYKGNYIQFQFYVEDQNFPSHIEKVNRTIMIRINVFELFRVLEKAVEAYRAELENTGDSDELQDKFIRAWSSIEEYTEKANENQSKEMEKLLEDLKLDSKSSAFLLKDLNDHLNVDILKIYSLYSLKIRRS